MSWEDVLKDEVPIEPFDMDLYSDKQIIEGIESRLRSSKEVEQLRDVVDKEGKKHDVVYQIWHGIDDSYTYFTPKAMKEVIDKKRSHWDGDVEL